jgi:hypothetical protein
MDKQIRKCFNNILTSSSFSTIGRFVWNRNKNRNYLAARKQRSDLFPARHFFARTCALLTVPTESKRRFFVKATILLHKKHTSSVEVCWNQGCGSGLI